MSFFAHANAARTGTPISSVDALVVNYANRLSANGRTMTAHGTALVREVFQSAQDNNAQVGTGWLGGSAVNVSKNLLLNLVASKSSLTGASLHGDSVQCEGMLTLRVAASGQGIVTNGESLFHNVPGQPYSVLFLMQAIGDPIDAPPAFYEANPITFSQGAGGYIRCALSQAILNNQSQFFGQGTTNGGSNTLREGQMDVQFCWVYFDGNGNWCAYNPSVLDGTPTAITGGTVTGRFEFGNLANQVPATLGLIGAIRFDGALTPTQRQNIYNRVWKKARNTIWAGLIVGNSVTITGVSDGRVSWPRITSRWGMYNNCLFMRRAQGAQRLPKFAPVGYALPPTAPYNDPDIATMSISLLDWYGANLFVNDDQQNMVPGQDWPTWLHCHNAFTTHLQQFNERPVRAVMCTQMAHIPLNFGVDYAPLPYPGFGNSKWRQVTFSTRAATPADFNNVPTTIADVWTAFNLGNTVSFGGLPSNPATDFANGNPDLFADRYSGETYLGKDAQHPNNAGHSVMANNVYIPAIQGVLAL